MNAKIGAAEHGRAKFLNSNDRESKKHSMRSNKENLTAAINACKTRLQKMLEAIFLLSFEHLKRFCRRM